MSAGYTLSGRLWAHWSGGMSAGVLALVFGFLGQELASAQAIGEWRHIGTSAIDLGLGSYATGPMQRVWFSADGNTIFAQAANGLVFQTTDLEAWRRSAEQPPARPDEAAAGFVSPGAEPAQTVRYRRAAGGRVFAFGAAVYRSDDGGRNWANLTRYRGNSILGDGLADLAASPSNPEELVVAASTGVWRSVDGGATWSGLNDALPNLPAARILSTPGAGRGITISSAGNRWEWIPGERKVWRVADGAATETEAQRNERLTAVHGVTITASAVVGNILYAGAMDGRIWSSLDGGGTWQLFRIAEAGRVERIVADPLDGRVAMAAIGSRPAELPQGTAGAHVLRTLNGGGFWDDLTSNLPESPAYGIAFDRASGAMYVATARGLYWTFGDLYRLAPATRWERAPGRLPDTAVRDVKLDAQGHQLYTMFEGEGVFAAIAPHRLRRPALVTSADLAQRSAAPGALLTLVGAGASAARAGAVEMPLLASSADRAEIQVPFEIQGSTVQFTVDSSAGPLRFGLPLETVAPAIFVDRDGAPMLLDAESGVLIDGSNPARAGSRVQILAGGLGRVRPDWPAGVAAPADAPPAVIAPVRVRIGGVDAEVTRAVLAPDFIGFYLVEVQVPVLVNTGAVDLVLEAAGKESNRVRVWLDR